MGSAPAMGYGLRLMIIATCKLGTSEHASQIIIISMCPGCVSSHNSDGLKRRTRSPPRRREEEESSEERSLSATCPVSGFNQACKAKLRKGNGDCKSGKKARCVLCSKCSDYSTGWCRVCARYGVRAEVDDNSHVQVGNLRACLPDNNNFHVPRMCVKPQFRRLEEEDEEPSKEEEEEESSEERSLSATCPVSGFNQACKAKLRKGNGDCKSGKKARCVLCS